MLPRLNFATKVALKAISFKNGHSAIEELRQKLKPLLLAPQSKNTELVTAAQNLDTLFAKIDHFFKEKNNDSLENLDDFLLEKLAPAKNYDLYLLQQPLRAVIAALKPTLILDNKALHYYDPAEGIFYEITKEPKVIAKLREQLIGKNKAAPAAAAPRTLSFNEQKIISSLTDYAFVDFEAKLIKLLIPEFILDDQPPAFLNEALQLTQLVAECIYKMHAAFQDLIKTAGYEEEVNETLLQLSEEFKKKNTLYQEALQTKTEPQRTTAPNIPVNFSTSSSLAAHSESKEAEVKVAQEPRSRQTISSADFHEAFQLKTAWEDRKIALKNQSQAMGNTLTQLQSELAQLFSEKDKADDEDQHAIMASKSSKMAAYLIKKNEIDEALRLEEAEYQKKIAALHQKILATQLNQLNEIQASLSLEAAKQTLLTISQSFFLENFQKKSLNKMQALIENSKKQLRELDQQLDIIKTKIQQFNAALVALENKRLEANPDLPSFDPLKNQLAELQNQHALLIKNKKHFESSLLQKAEIQLQKMKERQEQTTLSRRAKVNIYIAHFTAYLHERAETFKIRDFFSRLAAFFLGCFGYQTEKEKRQHYIQGKLIPQLQQYAHSGSKQDKTKLTTELGRGLEHFPPRSSFSQKSLQFFLSKTKKELMSENARPAKTSVSSRPQRAP